VPAVNSCCEQCPSAHACLPACALVTRMLSEQEPTVKAKRDIPPSVERTAEYGDIRSQSVPYPASAS
jgi:hypothetical protein